MCLCFGPLFFGFTALDCSARCVQHWQCLSFKQCKVSLAVQLHPSRLGDVKEGIHEQLNEYLMT